MSNRSKNHITLASDAYRLGNLDETSRHLYRHVQFHARDHEAWHFLGMVEFQRGKLDKALAALKKAVFLKPDFAEAHCNRGNVLRRSGHLEEALQSYERAIGSDAFLALAQSNRGSLLMQLGRLAEAVASFDRAIELDPNDPESWLGRGNVLKELGRLYDAIGSFDRALSIKPDFAEAYANRGVSLQALGMHDQALDAFSNAIRANPNYARAHFNRGALLSAVGRHEEALDAYDAAIRLHDGHAEVFTNRGVALQALGRLEKALESHDQALLLRPDYAEAHSNRGTVLGAMQRLDDAVLAFERALELDPDYARAYYNRGVLQEGRQQYDAALADYDRAIAISSDFSDAHLHQSQIDLLQGRFAQGWRGYEWRDQRRTLLSSRPEPVLPSLDDVVGKKIFVRWEQGLGDTILFCRYLPLLASAGAHVTFAPQPQMCALMRNVSGKINIVESDSYEDDFDFCVLLMSLPGLFGTEVSTIPSSTPYLSIDPVRVKKWRDQLGQSGFEIGICWQGNPAYKHDARRSFPVSCFDPLSKLAGVRLISLHKGEGERQMSSLPSGMKVETLGENFDAGLDSFLDTAAVMKNLDLVITSDTAIAHLAGALGVPVWLVLGRVAEWRWLVDRDDSPWYPTMRIFRQTVDSDWKSVFERITAALLTTLKEK